MTELAIKDMTELAVSLSSRAFALNVGSPGFDPKYCRNKRGHLWMKEKAQCIGASLQLCVQEIGIEFLALYGS